MTTNPTIRLFLLMLVGHVAHVFEEVWGRFWMIDTVFGLGWYLIINWILFCIPAAVFYLVLEQRRFAHILAMIYGTIMVVNGIGHNVATVATGRYFSGFAGGYTGLALVLVGLPFLYALRKDLVKFRPKRGG